MRAVTDLPEPGLADQRNCLALVELEGDVAHGLELPAFDLEGDADVAGVEDELAAVLAEIVAFGRGEGVGRASAMVRPQYGSMASRRPSPSALNANTVMSTKMTGDRIHG